MKSRTEYQKNPYSHSIIKWNKANVVFDGRVYDCEVIGNIYESPELLKEQEK